MKKYSVEIASIQGPMLPDYWGGHRGVTACISVWPNMTKEDFLAQYYNECNTYIADCIYGSNEYTEEEKDTIYSAICNTSIIEESWQGTLFNDLDNNECYVYISFNIEEEE
jgi:hypothetical protein